MENIHGYIRNAKTDIKLSGLIYNNSSVACSVGLSVAVSVGVSD